LNSPAATQWALIGFGLQRKNPKVPPKTPGFQHQSASITKVDKVPRLVCGKVQQNAFGDDDHL